MSAREARVKVVSHGVASIVALVISASPAPDFIARVYVREADFEAIELPTLENPDSASVFARIGNAVSSRATEARNTITKKALDARVAAKRMAVRDVVMVALLLLLIANFQLSIMAVGPAIAGTVVEGVSAALSSNRH